MSIDKRIEEKKKALSEALTAKGIMSKEVLKLSEELDKLIAQVMRRRWRRYYRIVCMTTGQNSQSVL